MTGVQSKLSIDLQQDNTGGPQRLTTVGLMGRYILKPQTERFERLPEIETSLCTWLRLQKYRPSLMRSFALLMAN